MAVVTIRPAVPEDAEGIARVFLESAELHAQLDPERYCVPELGAISERYRLGRQHPSPATGASVTVVADLGGEIAGFVDARLERSLDPMDREMLYCHVAEIAVSSRRRSQGLGEQLLEAAEEWGRQRGAEFASLEYHAANARAGAFYQERLGYRVASLTAIKRHPQHDSSHPGDGSEDYGPRVGPRGAAGLVPKALTFKSCLPREHGPTMPSMRQPSESDGVSETKIEVNPGSLRIPIYVIRSGRAGLSITCADPEHGFKVGTSPEQLQKFRAKLEILFSELVERRT